jgi:hypothetical protein
VVRPTTFGRQVRVYVSAEHLSALNREATLTGVTRSDVMREALSAYFARPDEEAS